MFFNIKVQAQQFEQDVGKKVIEYGNNLDLFEAMNKTIEFLFNVSIAITITFIAASGLQFILSAGDKAKVDNAKKSLTYSLIALAVIMVLNTLITYSLQLFGVGRVETVVSSVTLSQTGQ